MAQHNQVSVTLSAADLAEIQQSVQTLQQRLIFLVNLTPEERQAHARLGDKSLAFVEKSLEYAKENPQYVPPFLNVNEFERDMTLISQLRSILRPLGILLEGIDDTIMLAGSESYSAALLFYQSIKMAKTMNFAGTDSIYEELAKRFPGRSPSDDTATTQSTQPIV